MKKLIVAICVLFCLCPVFSKSLTFSGTGTTKEAAHLAVLQQIASTVSSTVNYSSCYNVSDSGTTARQAITTDTTSRTINLNSLFYLWSASTEETEENSYTITVEFSNEDESKIKESASWLISIIDGNERETIEDYIKVFEAWDLYEMISYLASELSISISSPASDKALLKVSFSALLKEEEKLLKREYKLLTTTEKRRKKINERLLELDEISQFYDINTVVFDKMPELEALIEVIEEQKEAISELFNKKESQIEYYISQAKTEIAEIEDEIKNRVWTSFDYDKTGNISENSKNKREAERKDRVDEVINNLNKEVKNLEDLYVTQIQTLLETLSENYSALQRSPEYTASTSSEKVSLVIEQYDPEKEVWPFTFTIKFSFGEVPFSGTIPFASAEKILDEPEASDDYESKIKAINLIDAKLRTLDGISAIVSYSLQPEVGSSKYGIKMNLEILNDSKGFYNYQEEKTLEMANQVSLIWRTYGLASTEESAITQALEKMGQLTGNEEYSKIVGKTSLEETGSLFIAKTDITSESISQLVEEIKQNNEALASLSIENDVLEIKKIVDKSNNVLIYLNSLGFFFNYEKPYNESYISAFYSYFCNTNGLIDSSHKKQQNLSSVQIKANGMLNSVSYTPQTNNELTSLIDEVEDSKKEFASKKDEITQALDEVKSLFKQKYEEDYWPIHDLLENVTGTINGIEIHEKKYQEISDYYNKFLPSALYSKESEMLSSYDYASDYQEITKVISEIEKGNYTFNSINSPTVNLYWGNTDLKTGDKYFVLSLQYDDSKYVFSDKINVSSIFSDFILATSEMGIEYYDFYEESIKALDCAAELDFFVAEITYDFDYKDIDETNCAYTLQPKNVAILRRDTGEVVYERKTNLENNLYIELSSVNYSVPEATIEEPIGYVKGAFSSPEKINKLKFLGRTTGLSFSIGFVFADGKSYRQTESSLYFYLNRLLIAPSINFKFQKSDDPLSLALSIFYRINHDLAVGIGVDLDFKDVNSQFSSSLYGAFSWRKFSAFAFTVDARIGISMAPSISFYTSASVGLSLNFF